MYFYNRAIAQKRKTDADKEEKRRQEILSRRREQIQHATEKYQRLNKPRAASAVSKWLTCLLTVLDKNTLIFFIHLET